MSVFNAALGHEINSGGLREASGTWAASSTQGTLCLSVLRCPLVAEMCRGSLGNRISPQGGPELLTLGAWDLFAQGIAAGASS